MSKKKVSKKKKRNKLVSKWIKKNVFNLLTLLTAIAAFLIAASDNELFNKQVNPIIDVTSLAESEGTLSILDVCTTNHIVLGHPVWEIDWLYFGDFELTNNGGQPVTLKSVSASTPDFYHDPNDNSNDMAIGFPATWDNNISGRLIDKTLNTSLTPLTINPGEYYKLSSGQIRIQQVSIGKYGYEDFRDYYENYLFPSCCNNLSMEVHFAFSEETEKTFKIKLPTPKIDIKLLGTLSRSEESLRTCDISNDDFSLEKFVDIDIFLEGEYYPIE